MKKFNLLVVLAICGFVIWYPIPKDAFTDQDIKNHEMKEIKIIPRIKQIEVLLDDEKGTVKNILGTTDPPVSPIPNKKRVPPGRKYQDIGIKYVRFCWETDHFEDYVSLDSIFVDNSKDANDKGNYDFTLIDKAMESCLRNGITPIFMLGLDINCFEDNFGKGYPKRTVSADGYVPDDYEKWVDVATNVIKHFNGLFDVPKQARKYSAGDVVYFSLWDEPTDYHPEREGPPWMLPMWTGDFSQFWKLYERLVKKIETDPELSSIKDIIKIGGPSSEYGKGPEFRFANKAIESKTRLDFINQDYYIDSFWRFLYDPIARGGSRGWNSQYNRIKSSDKRYNELEWHLGVFNFWTILSPFQGYRKPDRAFPYLDVNYETHYGAALLSSCLIYSEGSSLRSFIWHGAQGDYAETPAIPLAFGNLFNGKAKLMYPGLAYKMFSRVLYFNDEPAIKVTSKGEEVNISGEIRELGEGQLIGYSNQDVVQVLSVKSKNKKKIRVLIAKWNIDPEKNIFNRYKIKIRDTLEGKYGYKIFVVDKNHTFPDRCEECPTWDLSAVDISKLQDKIRNIVFKYKTEKGACNKLMSIYCPKNDQSIRKEDGLGIVEEGTIVSKNKEISLQVAGVGSSAVHLIKLSKI